MPKKSKITWRHVPKKPALISEYDKVFLSFAHSHVPVTSLLGSGTFLRVFLAGSFALSQQHDADDDLLQNKVALLKGTEFEHEARLIHSGKTVLLLQQYYGEQFFSFISSLLQENDRHPTYVLKLVINLLGQVCDQIQRYHDNGLIHMDVKPDNIYVLKDEKTGCHRVTLGDISNIVLRDKPMERFPFYMGILGYSKERNALLKSAEMDMVLLGMVKEGDRLFSYFDYLAPEARVNMQYDERKKESVPVSKDNEWSPTPAVDVYGLKFIVFHLLGILVSADIMTHSEVAMFQGLFKAMVQEDPAKRITLPEVKKELTFLLMNLLRAKTPLGVESPRKRQKLSSHIEGINLFPHLAATPAVGLLASGVGKSQKNKVLSYVCERLEKSP